MSLKPDFQETVTGYRWLDWITSPFWHWYFDRQERKTFTEIGGGSEAKGRALLRQAVKEHFDYDDGAML